MSGSGNDFILIDNRQGIVPQNNASAFAARICRRKMSAGADGLILIEDSDAADFRWQFFNSDGSLAEMCGNGARCAARFALSHGICGPNMDFETVAGMIRAEVRDSRVKVTLPKPVDVKFDYEISWQQGELSINSINTGVPHVVVTGFDLNTVDVAALGRELRFHPAFAPAGTNVNFVSIQSNQTVHIRTYERGVEDETLSCGTGAVAAAVVSVCRFDVPSPVPVLTRSGETLTVYVARDGNNIQEVCLEGGTRLIYEGILMEEAWQP